MQNIEILKLFRKLFTGKNSESGIFKNMAKLSAGTGFAKLIAIFSTPIISRIYLPEHMGVLALFTSIIALMMAFSSLKFPLAIPLPKNKISALYLVSLSFFITLLISIIVLIVFWLFGDGILMSFNATELVDYWWLIPLGFFLTSLYEIFTSWAIRVKSFGKYSKSIVWQNILGAGIKIALGIIGLKPIGLLIGQIFNQAGGSVSLFVLFYRETNSYFKKLTLKKHIFYFKYYQDFPKYRLPAQILLILSIKVPLFFFAWNFGVSETGQLGLALMMLGLPMRIFGETTAKAFYGEIAVIGNKSPQKIYDLTKSITLKLLVLGIIPFLILFFFAPWIFKIYFGTVWTEAGVYSSILSFYLITQFIYSPIGNGIFNIYKKQSLVLYINLIRIFIIMGAFSLAYFNKYSDDKTLYIYSISLSIYYLGTIVFVFYLLKKEVNKNLKP